MTERLFLDQPNLARADAVVVSSAPEGIVLDRTIFYTRGGGQPGDIGKLVWEGGEIAITDTVKGEGEAILHLSAQGLPLPAPGTAVSATIKSPSEWCGCRPPQVPTRISFLQPSWISSSNTIVAPGQPIPVPCTETGLPL